MPRRRRRLTGRDRRILEHLAEFHSAAPEILHARFYSDQKPEAVRSTMRRLSNGPHFLIQSVPLDGQRHWYQLTPAGVRLMGLKKYDCRTLGLHARARQFALQWFLFRPDGPDVRLVDLRDMSDLFPIGHHRLPQGKFYFRTEPAAAESATSVTAQSLGYLAFDFGGRPLRVAQRLQKTLKRFLQHGWFDNLITQDQFEITLLTPTHSRRRSFEHSLAAMFGRNLTTELSRFQSLNREDAIPIRLRVETVPGLFEIIYGSTR